MRRWRKIKTWLSGVSPYDPPAERGTWRRAWHFRRLGCSFRIIVRRSATRYSHRYSYFAIDRYSPTGEHWNLRVIPRPHLSISLALKVPFRTGPAIEPPELGPCWRIFGKPDTYKDQFIAAFKERVSPALAKDADYAWYLFEQISGPDREARFMPHQAVDLVLSVRG